MIKNRNIAADAAIALSKLAQGTLPSTSMVALANLTAGITSSHVIKFARLGAGITTTALVGLVVDDLVIRITTAGVATCKPVAVADTLPDDPDDTDYLIVLRAAA
jgi:hypothetical protein